MSNETAPAKEVKPYLTWGFGESEGSDAEFEWECMCDELTEVMRKINKGGKWYCTVENFGWRGLNGHKTFTATKGSGLLSAILPNTDCRFRIFVEGKGFGRYLKVQNYHHDSCTGREWYTVRRWKNEDPA